MQHLYTSVALPRILYGIDVWYTPLHNIPGRKKKISSVGLLKKLEKAQRITTLAINGGLRTTPTDLLDLHANILLMDLMLEKACHRAILLKKGHALPSSKLRDYIGHESQHTSYEAEVIGLLLGAHLLYREQNSLPGKVVIYVGISDVIRQTTTKIDEDSIIVWPGCELERQTDGVLLCT